MFGKLESLRGIAACAVILFHSSFNFGSEPISFVKNSYLFVDFFFILSGFVMSYAYKNKIAQGLSFSNYILLRLGRIYPLHLFMLLVFIPYVVIKQYLFNAGYGGGRISLRRRTWRHLCRIYFCCIRWVCMITYLLTAQAGVLVLSFLPILCFTSWR